MPKINVSVDVDSGKLSVTADGKEIPNVSDFSVYTYNYGEEEKRVECSFCVYEEENGLHKITRYAAYKSAEAAEATRSGKAFASQYDGFVKIPLGFAKDQVDCDISKFLKRGV